MSSLPYIIGAIVFAFVLGCATGYSNRDGAAKASAAKAYKASEDQRIKMQGKIDLLSAQYEEERKRVASVNVQRTNTIKDYYHDVVVPAECALPNPMYSLLVNSVRDANVATGEPSNAVSSTSKPTPTGH